MDNPERHLPLKPVVYLILLSLAPEPCHGYLLKRRVADASEGTVRLDPGTLYRWMARLLDQGWVVELERRPVGDSDERRRYYELTAAGRRLLSLESQRLDHLLETARGLRLIPKLGTSQP